MSRLLPELQLAVYFLESKKSLKQGHYRKQFTMLNYHLEKVNNQSHLMKMKLCRRIVYCLIKILQSYQKHDELLNNKKTLQLFRGINRYLIIYHNTMEEYYGRDFEKKSKVRLSFYAREMLQLLLRTMQIRAVYVQGTSLDARGMNKFFKAQEAIFQNHRKKIDSLRRIFINFNFKQAQMYYMLSLFQEAHFFLEQNLPNFQPIL